MDGLNSDMKMMSETWTQVRPGSSIKTGLLVLIHYGLDLSLNRPCWVRSMKDMDPNPTCFKHSYLAQGWTQHLSSLLNPDLPTLDRVDPIQTWLTQDPNWVNTFFPDNATQQSFHLWKTHITWHSIHYSIKQLLWPICTFLILISRALFLCPFPATKSETLNPLKVSINREPKMVSKRNGSDSSIDAKKRKRVGFSDPGKI